MPTGWSLEADREVRLVGLGLAAALVIAGLLGLVEKGPVVPALHLGSSPLSPLSYGTSSLYEMARSRYGAAVILEPGDLEGLKSERCVLVVVSPAVPIEGGEARSLVRRLREACGSLAVLVADEETTSNGLLEALNSSIRIAGNRIGVPQSGGVSYHPVAYLRVGERTILARLDLASEVRGGVPSGFAVGYVVLPGDALRVRLPHELPVDSASGGTVVTLWGAVPVASEEVVGGVHVYAIGDGSVLVNQVLDSADPTYRELAEALLDYLCAGSGDCLVVFDARHYAVANPLEALSGEARWLGELAGLRDALYVVLAAAVTMLHPALWLPPLFRAVDEHVFGAVLGRGAAVVPPHLAAYAAVLLAAAGIALPLCRRWGTARDGSLPEQLERDVYIAAGLRDSILRGSVKLGPGDFANLYAMVDSALRSVLGVGLSDGSLPGVLGRYVGEGRALEFWRAMNGLYRRATGKTLWPLVVSWRRSVLRYLAESEEVLAALGESLERAAAPERLLSGGAVLGGTG